MRTQVMNEFVNFEHNYIMFSVVSIGVNHKKWSVFARYKQILGGKRGYFRNMLQWSKNDFKSMINTNGDYYPLLRYNGSMIKSRLIISRMIKNRAKNLRLDSNIE